MRRVALLLLIVAGCRNAQAQPKLDEVPAELAKGVALTVVAKGFDRPVALVAAPGDTSGRLFVVEQRGKVRILRGGKIDATDFLDLSDRLSTGNEQGLLGLAFHPKFAENRRLFVNYTDEGGDTHIVEFTATKQGDGVDTKSEKELLKIPQPYSNHNGGNLAFGPDGKLWIGMGDGGDANDPHGNGQNPKALLGKMLILDVDAAGTQPDIHMIGLRNPWRWSFDAKTGDLYIGDVGQNKWEEIDVIAAADALKGGQNLGWNVVEGAGHCFKPPSKCKQTGLVAPVVDYGHDQGCSVTGGFVYRGKALPQLDGTYFYADYCTALLRSFTWSGGAATNAYDWKKALDPKNKLAKLSSFGVDADGELYLLSLDGIVYEFTKP